MPYVAPPAPPMPINAVPPHPVTGRAYSVPYYGSASATSFAVGTALATPFTITRPVDVPYGSIRVDTVAAATNAVARVAIYTNSTAWEPGQLIADLGSQSVAAAGATVSWTLTAAQGSFQVGTYWVALVSQVASGNLRSMNAAQLPTYPTPLGTNAAASLTMTGVSGAFPTTWTTAASQNTCPRFQLSL